MSKKMSISEAGFSFIRKAVGMEKQARAEPLRLGSPSKSYNDFAARKAHAATLTGGRGFMQFSTKKEHDRVHGSDRGNKRRMAKFNIFKGLREAYAARLEMPFADRPSRAEW